MLTIGAPTAGCFDAAGKPAVEYGPFVTNTQAEIAQTHVVFPPKAGIHFGHGLTGLNCGNYKESIWTRSKITQPSRANSTP